MQVTIIEHAEVAYWLSIPLVPNSVILNNPERQYIIESD